MGTARGDEPTEDDEVKLRTGQINWRRINNDVIVLDAADASYLDVNASGAALWELLSAGTTRHALVAELADRFDLSPDQARNDVDAFLVQLREQGLLDDSAP